LRIVQGQVVEFIVKDVKGKKTLPSKQLADFRELTEKIADEIVRSWIDYFILNKRVIAKKIAGKL